MYFCAIVHLTFLLRFSDVDSAEKCIEGLRKYRNLHPSFSKVNIVFLVCTRNLKIS